jgi:hypothetical protein
VIEKATWRLAFTPPGEPGKTIGLFKSRDEAMLAAQPHFERLMGSSNPDEVEELGWQMSFNGATALSPVGIYRVAKL